MTIYQCKKDKNVVLLSTLHEKALIPSNNNPKSKPITILDHNKSKVGVDCVDQMTRQYSVYAATRRWPVCVFYYIINLSIINSWILYKNVNHSQISRRSFIISLIEEIQSLNTANKENTPSVKRKADVNIETPKSTKKVRRSLIDTPSKECQIKLCNKNKSKAACSICNKACCGKCAAEIKVIETIICKKFNLIFLFIYFNVFFNKIFHKNINNVSIN